MAYSWPSLVRFVEFHSRRACADGRRSFVARTVGRHRPPLVHFIVSALVTSWMLAALLPSPAQAKAAGLGVPISTFVPLRDSTATEPDAVADGFGGQIIVWQDDRSGNFDIYAQRVDSSGAALWTTNGSPVCVATGVQCHPRVVADGLGGAVVAWEDNRGGTWQVYAQRLHHQNGVLWAEGGVALGAAAGDQQDLDIISDGNHGAIVTWADTRNGNPDIYAQHLIMTGDVSWAGGTPVCTNAVAETLPRIVSDGAGGAIITWVEANTHSLDIEAQRLGASGAVQWTSSGLVLVAAAGDQTNPRIATDGAGGAIVAWQDSRALTNSDVYAQRVNASGVVQWTGGGVVVSNATGNQTLPEMIADGAGGAVVTWQDGRNGTTNTDIYVQRMSPAGAALWTANGVVLGATTNMELRPQIAACDVGGAIVAWEMNSGGYPWIHAQRVDAIGAVQWVANGVEIGAGLIAGSRVRVVADGVSGAMITSAHRDATGENSEIACSRIRDDGLVPWTQGVCSDRLALAAPAAASDGSGGLIVTWRDYGGAGNIYAQRMDGGGTPLWPRPGVLVGAPPAHYAYGMSYLGARPVITSDGMGGAIIAWSVESFGGWVSTLYAQRVSASGSLLWESGGVWVYQGADDGSFSGVTINPVLASDGTGGAILTWEQAQPDGSRQTLLAQRINAAGALQWSSPDYGENALFLTFSYTGWDAGPPSLAADGAGGALIAWCDYRNEATSGLDVYAQHVSASGSRMWSDAALPVCTVPGVQRSPRLAPDGSGGAVVAWDDRRTSAPGVYAQRLGADGARQWAVDGVAVSIDPGFQTWLEAVLPDSSHGAIVEWRHDDVYPNSNLVAQRVDATSRLRWPEGGVPLCAGTASTTYLATKAISDGYGGAIFAWNDQRSGIYKAYAQRVSGNGAVAWDAGGMPLCDADSSQIGITLAADGSGGAFFAWEDGRSGRSQIYSTWHGCEPCAYTVTAAAGPFGSISPAGNVPVGWRTDALFTITPAAGFHRDSLLVDEVSVTPAASYAFSDVTANHSIRATFAFNGLSATLASPASLCLVKGATTGAIVCQAHIDSLTRLPGGPSGLLVDLGYGPRGSDPALGSGWTWVSAGWVASVGEDDRYAATITPATAGLYDYCFRVRYAPVSAAWTYVDLDGSADGYSASQAGQLVVVGPTASQVNAAWPSTDGEVHALALGSATLYMGGTFHTVWPAGSSSGCVAVDASSAAGLGFPRVHGTVHAAISDGSGGWFVAGSFDSVGGLPRSNVARVLADLSVGNWQPSVSVGVPALVNGPVEALALSGGVLYAGGSFTQVATTTCNRIAALDATTGVLQSAWNPNANGAVSALAVGGTNVYVGGSFTTIGGQARSAIAALSTATGLATTWNPSAPSGAVYTLLLSGSTLYAGGSFTNIGSKGRNRIAALDVSSNTATNWNPNANGVVHALALADGLLYVGGEFTTVGGASRSRVAALDPATNSATAWNPGAGGTVRALAAGADRVYLGGAFTTVGGLARNRVASVLFSGGGPLAWDPAVNGEVRALAIGAAGIGVGGDFTRSGGLARSRLAALDATSGTIIGGWAPSADSTVYALAVSGGTVYAGGEFHNAGGLARNHVAAFDTISGAVSSTFNPNASAMVHAIAVYDSAVYMGGDFTTIGGATRQGIAALNLAGTAYSTWTAGASLRVVEALLIREGVLYAGGTSSKRLAAMNLATGAFTAWNPTLGGGGDVHAVATADSLIYAGGLVGSVCGQSRRGIAALDAASGLAAAWDPSADNTVYALAVNGRTVYAGGAFSSMSGVPAAGIAAITYDLASWAVLGAPASDTAGASVASDTLRGRAWFDGVTDGAGAPATVVAQLGFGPDGSDPAGGGWTWSAATYDGQAGNSDQYAGQLMVSSPGTYDYCFRYSCYGGPWLYADLDGSLNGYDPAQAGSLVVTTTVGVRDAGGPRALALRALGNPFRGRASLQLVLPRDGRVELAIFDVMGRRVRTVVDGPLTAGIHALAWDGCGRSGSRVDPGVYLARVAVEGQGTRLVKIVALR